MAEKPARRTILVSLLAAASALSLTAPGVAHADTPIKFQLDWRFEGPSALFLVPAAKGYFKQAGLDVSIDAGSGLPSGTLSAP